MKKLPIRLYQTRRMSRLIRVSLGAQIVGFVQVRLKLFGLNNYMFNIQTHNMFKISIKLAVMADTKQDVPISNIR